MEEFIIKSQGYSDEIISAKKCAFCKKKVPSKAPIESYFGGNG